MANPIQLKSILVVEQSIPTLVICQGSLSYIRLLTEIQTTWKVKHLFLTLLYSCIKVCRIEIYAADSSSGQIGRKRKIEIYKNQPTERTLESYKEFSQELPGLRSQSCSHIPAQAELPVKAKNQHTATLSSAKLLPPLCFGVQLKSWEILATGLEFWALIQGSI